MIQIKKLFQDTHGRFDSSKLVLYGYRAAVVVSITILYLTHAKACV